MLLALIDHTSEEPPSQVAALPHKSTSASDLTPEALYELVAPSVVTIIVNDEDGEAIGSGSGFLVDGALLSGPYEHLELPNQLAKSQTDGGTPIQFGYVITNYHVIRPAVSVDVVLSNGDEGHVLTVIAEDENRDSALLLVYFLTSQPLKGIPFAMQNPRVLSTVYAIGSPMGLSGSASEGKVSGFRELPTGGQWLQTTAPISPGSSGGPLLQSDGMLAGVTTMFLKDAQNLNFAIPVSSVRTFLKTARYQSRSVAEGASIAWHWEFAFVEMEAALKWREYTDAERDAVALLEQANQVQSEGYVSRQRVESYRQVIALVSKVDKSLPAEFRYLMHLVIGEASRDAASESIQASRRTFTGEEQQTLYRASTYAHSAQRHLKMAATLKPDSPLAFASLYHHYAIGGNWMDAFLAADTLVSLMPRCADALGYRGKCYFELNQPEAGVRDYQAAIELSPRNGSLRQSYADRLLDSGKYEEAIESYEAAIPLLSDSDRHPDNVLGKMARVRLGDAYKKSGNFAKAISAFSKAKSMGLEPEYCDREIAECKRQLR